MKCSKRRNQKSLVTLLRSNVCAPRSWTVSRFSSHEEICGVRDSDFLLSACPCSKDLMFLQPLNAFIAQSGPKYNPHTDHDTLAEERAARRPTEQTGLAHGLLLYTSTLLCLCYCDRFQCTGTDNSLVIAC